MLQRLCGERQDLVPALTAAFREHYDSMGCLRSSPYDGIEDVLRTLTSQRVKLLVATNKRAAPTRRIVDHLGWNSLFAAMCCIDDLVVPPRNKAAMVGHLIAQHDLPPDATALLGDSVDDANAARDHGLRFLVAEWGYGVAELHSLSEPVYRLGRPLALLGR
jgi:phosphoglycolate phosphatase